MGLWQYTFQILSKDSCDNLYKVYNSAFNDMGFDSEPFWQYTLTEKSYFNEMDNILQRRKSWSKNIDLYGDQESNCFEVLYNEVGIIQSVSFRIDFRTNFESILNKIINFCMDKSLVILDENLNKVPLYLLHFEEIIYKSSQVKKYNILAGKKG